MIEFIATADVHLERMPFNLPMLKEDIFTIFSAICDAAIARKVKYLVNCGDLFDTNKPTAKTVAFVRDHVERLRSHGIACVGIAGDHDKPIDEASWALTVAGFKLPQDETPMLFGVSYNDNPEVVHKALINNPNAEITEWIFLHGQVPQLFDYCTEKKMLDFSKIPIEQQYPSLKGIILGDIHTYSLCRLNFGTKDVPIVYCGAPGCINTGEAKEAKSVMHIKNDKTGIIDVPQPRKWEILDINDPDFNCEKYLFAMHEKYANKNVAKPVFVIKYHQSQKKDLHRFNPLFQWGEVRHSLQKTKATKETEKVGSVLRSELKTEEKIQEALTMCGLSGDLKLLVDNLVHDVEGAEAILNSWKLTQL